MNDRERELEAALLGMKHRTLADGSPCWCFLWPDEEHKSELILSGAPEEKGSNASIVQGHCEECLTARAALEPLLRGDQDEVYDLRAQNSKYLAGLNEAHFWLIRGGTREQIERAIAHALEQPLLTPPKSPIK